MAVLTSATPGQEGGGAVPMRPSVARENESVVQSHQSGSSSVGGGSEQQQSTVGDVGDSISSETSQQQPQQQQQQQPSTYMVTVPPGIMPGMQFYVEVEGQRMSK